MSNVFDELNDLVCGIVIILISTETKLDNSFLQAQLLMEGDSPRFHLDKN